VLPWYQQQRFRLAGAALLAGLVIGGLVTLALGYQSTPPAAIPERSAAEAIASDQAAVATATATATARPKASARPAKKPKHTQASVPVSSAATAEPTATSTPDDEELGGNSPASTPAPARSAPRRQSVATKPRTQIKPVVKKPTPTKPAPTPRPTAPAPTPAPTAAAPQPAATATPNPPHRPPHPHPGDPGGDDDPGTS
jgi:hypothetical protein